MELESTNSGPTAKLPILKLGECLHLPLKKRRQRKKNDVKARGLLLMALPNEHQLTFSQYPDAKSMLAAIETRFGEDLNLKFLSSLPPEWNTHVVVWMNKPEIETMSIDDLYNNFKIVEQKIKKTVGTSSGGQNLAFMTAPNSSSTNDANTAYSKVSAASPSVNTASPQVCTTSVSDNTVYAFMVENPNGSNVLHQDLEQIHEDDLEAMDLKWQLSLLSVRAKKYYQKTGKKIFINGNDIAGYDKSKVECYNCHKLGHFARECRASRSKEDQFRNQDNTRKQGNKEDTSKAMLAIDGVGFDWSDMAEEQKQYDDLLAKLHESIFKASTYKRGLDTVEAQLVTYRKNEVLFSEEVVVLKREVGIKQYEINMLKTEFEKVKKEKDGIEFKIEKFDKASKDLVQPNKLDLSYFGLDEFKEPEFKGYGPENSKKESNVVCEKESDNSKENFDKSLVKEQELQVKSSFVEGCGSNTSKNVNEVEPKKVKKNNDAPIINDWMSDDKEQDESNTKPKKKTEGIREIGMRNCTYHQKKKVVSGNNYNRVDNYYYAKTSHHRTHKNVTPRAVLLRTGLKPLSTAKHLSHKVNTVRPRIVDTARLYRTPVNTVRPKVVNTVRSNRTSVNAARANGFNAGKPQHDDKGFVDSGCSRHMTGNIAYLSDFKQFDGGYVAFGGGAYGGKISGKGTLKTANLDFEDVQFLILCCTSEGKQSSVAIMMPIWKDSLYFDSPTKNVDNDEPKTADDAQKQDEDGLNNENDEQERVEMIASSKCLYCLFIMKKTSLKKIPEIEPTSIAKALSDSSWVEAMQEELLQFKLQQVWILVDLPNRKKAIGTKWVFRNKKDERGIVIRNKAW
ncbi:putative ribonuclease H-like domain-containing protein [Tanacetum coccineum]